MADDKTGPLELALRAIVAAHDRMRAAERARADAAVERAEAISRAIAAGVRPAAIAERLGVTPQRISQMQRRR